MKVDETSYIMGFIVATYVCMGFNDEYILFLLNSLLRNMGKDEITSFELERLCDINAYALKMAFQKQYDSLSDEDKANFPREFRDI